jgi:hypothetical protein
MGQQGTIVFAADVSSRRLDCLRIHARNLLERAARGLAFVRSVTRDIKPYMAASISAQVLRGNRHWGGLQANDTLSGEFNLPTNSLGSG